MNTYQLHIGANNTTGIVEKDRIIQVLSSHYDGFTLQDTVGYWKGTPEYSCIATIANVTESDGIVKLARELAQVLEQDAVGVTAIPTGMDFITAQQA